jgi:hypothetical protein
MAIKFFQLIMLFSISCTIAQNKEDENWCLYDGSNTQIIKITGSGSFEIEEFRIRVIWDEKLSHSENLGYYGGIAEMIIYKGDQTIFTGINIEDGIALGIINLTFYDYNLDGHIDFTIPIDCGRSCYDKYYLFDPVKNIFLHASDWDYLRIQKLNKVKKQLISQPEGNAMDTVNKLFQINGLDLTELNKV